MFREQQFAEMELQKCVSRQEKVAAPYEKLYGDNAEGKITDECKDNFLAAIRKFMQVETLTAPFLRELIYKIKIYEIEGTGRNRTQRVMIHYRFVGYIELPKQRSRVTTEKTPEREWNWNT